MTAPADTVAVRESGRRRAALSQLLLLVGAILWRGARTPGHRPLAWAAIWNASPALTVVGKV